LARILLSSYMVRYPMGGMLSWALQYALGFHRLGHEVFLLERADYPDACFDPERQTMSDNCRPGFATVRDLLARFGLEERLVFEDINHTLYGMNRTDLREIFRTADLLVDSGNHGAWLSEARKEGIPTVLIDGEPGFTQIKMEQAAEESREAREFDHYYSNGANIGTELTTAPNAGRSWRHVFNPVDTALFQATSPPANSCFTTVMNWQSHAPVRFKGKDYGQKDLEFARFMDLPQRISVPLEVAVAGQAPQQELQVNGWRLRDAHQVTRSYDGYRSYIAGSMGEFSVCKNVFVATRSGWFSDRSAAYLASGRPVVLQDTGFSTHLPCGEGLFAVSDVEQAAVALEEIVSHYPRHARRARELAETYLDARQLMGRVLSDVGL